MSTLMNTARTRAPRIAEAAAERARLTVVPRRAQRAPRVPFVTLVSVLLVGGVVGLLLFNTSMQQASFTATSMEQRASVLDAKEQALKMRLDMLRDPQRVALRAKRLGMVPATSPAFLRLSDGKVLGKPQVAEPGDAMRITPLPTRKPASLRPRLVIAAPAATPGPARAGKQQTGRRDTAAASADSGSAAGTKNKHAHRLRQGSNR